MERVNEKSLDTAISPIHDPWIEEQKKIDVKYYFLRNDSDYHYEIRYEFNVNSPMHDHRLMIFTGGRGRTCTDYWRFAVGRRIVYAMRAAGFSMLAICSKRRLYETEDFVLDNQDVKWIYKTLQRWINDIYYQQFKHYPILYIHGVSRGSAFAPLLTRVLPIRALILTVYPGHKKALTTRSAFSSDLQIRLLLDTTFANWFYFDFCYNARSSSTHNQSVCPFETELEHFYPIPPTYFVALDSDPSLPLKRYTELIQLIRSDSLALGGELLHQQQSIMLDILSPIKLTPTYMQENFDLWYNKPYASQIFFEYFNNASMHVTNDTKHGTCRCLKTNFTYWEGFPNITATWPLRKQAQHNDYLRDMKEFHSIICEEICGDITVYHGVVSRNIQKALDWVSTIDSLRNALLIRDYISRPLRLWMYRKQSIINGIGNFSSNTIDWTLIRNQYQMYYVEYLIQDYVANVNDTNQVSGHNFIWTEDPLLADYFIIPHDLMYYYFHAKSEELNRTHHDALKSTLNADYFEKFLQNMWHRFPYWTMAATANQFGSNHILTSVGNEYMSVLDEKHQKTLQNVIQLVLTGSRGDLSPSTSSSLYSDQDTNKNYRHGYDIVIPDYINPELKKTLAGANNTVPSGKKHLFYFDGSFDDAVQLYSSSPRLVSAWSEFLVVGKSKMRTEIEGISYQTLLVNDGLMTPMESIKSIGHSVFSLSSENLFPWSHRIYQAIQLGTIPVILADNLVLPFERFIEWRSFTVKINGTNIHQLISRISKIIPLKSYIEQKQRNLSSYSNIFRWIVRNKNDRRPGKEKFLSNIDSNEVIPTAFHYVALELRCRRLEQLYGLTSDVSSATSRAAQQNACENHPNICPCHSVRPPLAFHEYL